MSSFDSRAFLKSTPHQSGVYRMLDAQGTIIYVGKAIDLKKRLASYFRAEVDSAKTRALVGQIAAIDITVTHTETEALILEHNLIKEHLPRYNVLLRDDRAYPWLLLTQHHHPRLMIHRGARKQPGDYFGPYPSGGAVRASLNLMQKIFLVRQCDESTYGNRTRPCLLYQLKRCCAPCVAGHVSEAEYAERVEMVRLFLTGKNRQAIELLVAKMEQASSELRFEEAARYRDQIVALRKVSEQQWVSGAGEERIDLLGMAEAGGVVSIHLLQIRQGAILGSRNYFPKVPAATELTEVMHAFLLQFYLSPQRGNDLPQQVLLDLKLDDEVELAQALSSATGQKITLSHPQRGERARFLALATTNAKSALQTHLAQKSHIEQRYRELEKLLGGTPIQRMECFDISHTQGECTVAANVVFNREGALKSDYRRYNIEGITGGDDYAAMEQALTRRFAKAQLSEKIPDLLFIDGGIGQLHRAEAVLARCEFPEKRPRLIGIAKGEGRKPGLETLILGGSYQELNLESSNLALHLIQQIRDESHRFAITGHRARRNKARRESSLESLSGVGAKRRQALLAHLGGLQEVKNASVEELCQVPGISRALSERIYAFFHEDSG